MNREKINSEPSRIFEWLNAVRNTSTLTFSVPKRKVEKLIYFNTKFDK